MCQEETSRQVHSLVYINVSKQSPLEDKYTSKVIALLLVMFPSSSHPHRLKYLNVHKLPGEKTAQFLHFLSHKGGWRLNEGQGKEGSWLGWGNFHGSPWWLETWARPPRLGCLNKKWGKKRQPKNRGFFLMNFWILSTHRVYKIVLCLCATGLKMSLFFNQSWNSL